MILPTRSAAVAIAALVLLPAAVVAGPPLPQVAVTSCGQVVPKKTIGYLTADLDCTGFTGGPPTTYPGYAGAAVYLEKKSRLDLRGFTITAGMNGVLCGVTACTPGKKCPIDACEVYGGTIVGTPGTTGSGIAGERPTVHDVTVSGGVIGIYGDRKLLLSDAVVQDTFIAGVQGGGLRLTGVTVTNSGQFGVNAWTDRGPAAHVAGSSITGNGTAAFCGTSPCGDLFAAERPLLKATSCNTSVAPNGGSWHVCSLD